eukprot:COSAG01_NODE_624_length_14732_cov_58.900772_2_plen_2421_part_00
MTSSATTTGYEAIDIMCPSDGWSGLRSGFGLNASSPPARLIGCCFRSSNAQYTVGSSTEWRGGIAVANSVATQVELYVKRPRNHTLLKVPCNVTNEIILRHLQREMLTSGRLGIDSRQSSSIAAADFNKDGVMDLYIANINQPNQLFEGDQKSGFQEVTALPSVIHDNSSLRKGVTTKFPTKLATAASLNLISASFSAMARVWLHPHAAAKGVRTIFGTDRNDRDSLHAGVNDGVFFFGFGSSIYCAALNAAKAKPGTWQHVAFVYSSRSKTQRIYIDGIMVAKCMNRPPFVGTSTISIGQANGRDDWMGTIKEIAFYSVELSTKDIQGASRSVKWMKYETRTSFPLSISDAKSLGMTESSFTAMAWVNRHHRSGSGDNTVFGTDETSHGKGLHLIVRGHRYFMGFFGMDCGSSAVSRKGRWEHVAFVYNKDAQTQQIYVNGVLEGTCANRKPFTGTGVVKLGQWSGNKWTSTNWIGSIKDAAIYNRALTTQEIIDISMLQKSTNSSIVSGEQKSQDIAVADVDGDGWVDIYVANDGQPNQLFVNNRQGEFWEATANVLVVDTQTSSSTALAIADLNGDKALDVIVANNRQHNQLYINKYSVQGQFIHKSEPVNVTTVAHNRTWMKYETRDSFPLSISDAKSLGMTESSFTAMAWVNRHHRSGSGDNTVFGTDETSHGKGLHLIVRGHRYFMGFFGMDCGSSAVSRKGRWEHVAFVYNKDAQTQQIYVNGVLEGTCANRKPFTGTGVVKLGQWSGNKWTSTNWIGSIKDAAIYNRALTTQEIVSAGFNSVTAGQHNSQDVATADVDGDGWNDIYVANYGQPNELFINNRHGSFKQITDSPVVLGNYKSLGIAAADLNADGWTDLYITNDRQSNQLFVNDRLGSFRSLDDGPGSTWGRSNGAIAADINGDGVLDLYVFKEEQANQLFLGDKSGQFVEVNSGPALKWGPRSRSAAVVDLNNNGKVNLVVANYGTPTQLLTERERDNFIEGTSSIFGKESSRLNSARAVVADLNKDGIVDVYVVNYGEANELFINTRFGTFATAVGNTAVSGNSRSRDVAAVDMNGDGWIDLYIANNGQPNQVFLNDKKGSFIPEYLTVDMPSDVSAQFDAVNLTNGHAWSEAQALTSFPYKISNAKSLGMTNSSFTAMAWVNRRERLGAIDYTVFGTQATSIREGLHFAVRYGKYYMGFFGAGMDCSSSAVSTTETWEHVAFVYDRNSQTQQIYVNGHLVSACKHRLPFIGTDMVSIGQWSGNKWRPTDWKGSIREAAIYNRAMPAAEIFGVSHLPKWMRADSIPAIPLIISDAKSLGMTESSFTAMAWVNRHHRSGSGDNTVFGTDETSHGKGLHLIVRGHRYFMGFFGMDCGSSAVSRKGRWEHVAFVYNKDAQTQQIYVNGVLEGTCANRKPFTGTGVVKLGQWSGNKWTSTNWIGSIKDAAIYNRALSQTEILYSGFMNISAGITTINSYRSQRVVAADTNSDGAVDLIYVVNYADPNQRFVSLPNGKFNEVTSCPTILGSKKSYDAVIVDLNADGSLDLYVVNWLDHNQLFFNSDGIFTEQIGIATGTGFQTSRSVVAADFNRDGFMDLYVANFNAENQLIMNNRKGNFVEISAHKSGKMRSQDVSSGDFNADGWADVYVANNGEPNQLLINDKSGRLVDTVSSIAVHGNSRSNTVTVGDFNGDNVDDIYVCNQGVSNQLFLNDPCPDGYAKARESADCFPCPSYSTDYVWAADQCSLCPAGTIAPAGLRAIRHDQQSLCIPCPAGRRRTEQMQVDQCLPCLPGRFSTAGASLCSRCGAGSVASGYSTAGSCTKCNPGKQPNANQTICTNCNEYSFSQFGVMCQPCPAGYVPDPAHTVCIDDDECATPTANDCDPIRLYPPLPPPQPEDVYIGGDPCINQPGSFSCAPCPLGFSSGASTNGSNHWCFPVKIMNSSSYVRAQPTLQLEVQSMFNATSMSVWKKGLLADISSFGGIPASHFSLGEYVASRKKGRKNQRQTALQSGAAVFFKMVLSFKAQTGDELASDFRMFRSLTINTSSPLAVRYNVRVVDYKLTCPAGYIVLPGLGVCTRCPADEVVEAVGKGCTSCPFGQIPNEIGNGCICEDGRYNVSMGGVMLNPKQDGARAVSLVRCFDQHENFDQAKFDVDHASLECESCPYLNQPGDCVKCKGGAIFLQPNFASTLRFQSLNRSLEQLRTVRGATSNGNQLRPVFLCQLEGQCLGDTANTTARGKSWCGENYTGALCSNCAIGTSRAGLGRTDPCVPCIEQSMPLQMLLVACAFLFVVAAKYFALGFHLTPDTSARIGVALIVGNGHYSGGVFSSLDAPAADSTAVAQKLDALGYLVIRLTNGSKEDIEEAIETFQETIKTEQRNTDVDIAAVFYCTLSVLPVVLACVRVCCSLLFTCSQTPVMVPVSIETAILCRLIVTG